MCKYGNSDSLDISMEELENKINRALPLIAKCRQIIDELEQEAMKIGLSTNDFDKLVTSRAKEMNGGSTGYENIVKTHPVYF